MSMFFELKKEDAIFEEVADAFNTTPLVTRKCVKSINSLLYYLCNNKMKQDNINGILVFLLKTYQSKEKYLKNIVYNVLIDLSTLTDQGLIGINIMVKDYQTYKHKDKILKCLFCIVPDEMVYDYTRYIGECYMSNNDILVHCSVLICHYLLNKSFTKVKDLYKDLYKSMNITDDIQGYHKIALLPYKNSKNVYKNEAGVMCVRSAVLNNNLEMFKTFLNVRLVDKFVFFEACKQVVCMNTEHQVQYTALVCQGLRSFLKSDNFYEKFSCMRILSALALKYPKKVSVLNKEIEDLLQEDSKTLPMMAISTLLKTATDESVDRLIKYLPEYMDYMDDEYKKMVLQALCVLTTQNNEKVDVFISFVKKCFYDRGSLEFKMCIVQLLSDILDSMSSSSDSMSGGGSMSGGDSKMKDCSGKKKDCSDKMKDCSGKKSSMRDGSIYNGMSGTSKHEYEHIDSSNDEHTDNDHSTEDTTNEHTNNERTYDITHNYTTVDDITTRIMDMYIHYLEDSEYNEVTSEILGIVSRHICRVKDKEKYVAHIYNRLILESEVYRMPVLQCAYDVCGSTNIDTSIFVDCDDSVLSNFYVGSKCSVQQRSDKHTDIYDNTMKELGTMKEQGTVKEQGTTSNEQDAMKEQTTTGHKHTDLSDKHTTPYEYTTLDNIQQSVLGNVHKDVLSKVMKYYKQYGFVTIQKEKHVKVCRELHLTDEQEVEVRLTKVVSESTVLLQYRIKNMNEELEIKKGTLSVKVKDDTTSHVVQSVLPGHSCTVEITVSKESGIGIYGEFDYELCFVGEYGETESDSITLTPCQLSIFDIMDNVECKKTGSVKRVECTLVLDLPSSTKKILDLVNLKMLNQRSTSNTCVLEMSGVYNDIGCVVQVEMVYKKTTKCMIEIWSEDTNLLEKISKYFE